MEEPMALKSSHWIGGEWIFHHEDLMTIIIRAPQHAEEQNIMLELKTHQGACHCGAVKFEIDAPSQLHAHACNCSICYQSGGDQMIVPTSRFRLLCGEDAITTYTFNTGAAQHTFCKHCGIKAFYTPRSNPDGFSVNLRCLDRTHVKSIVVDSFDGQNWEQNAGALAHLSREG
jgi:hypothetical protein